MVETQADAVGAASHIIKRPRLTKILDETEARIILLCAPAGYGKTTLAREWVATRSERVLWYSGGPAMADVAALAVDLAQVLNPSDDDLVERIRFRASRGASGIELARELTKMTQAEVGILVIDDYHYMADSADAQELFEELLRQTSFRLLITSRSEPRWLSARRVIYGEAFVLHSKALAFSRDEAEMLSSDVTDLAAQAEGWPAVLGLAARRSNSLQSLPTDRDHLYEFFARELYGEAPSKIQQALRLLALGADATIDVTKEVLGRDWEHLLDESTRRGFTTRSGQLETSIHPLLRGFLLAELRSEGPQAAGAAVSRIVNVLVRNHRWDECLAALRAFPDIALIENALGGALDQLLDAGRTATVREWIDLATEHGGESSGIALRARAELALRAARGPEARVLGERAALRAADPEMAAKALLAAARGSHLAEDTPGLIKNAHAAARTSSDPTVQVLALWLAFVHAYEHEHPIGAQLLERLKRVAGPRTEDAIRVACGEAYLGLRNTGPTPALAAIAGHEALIDDIRDPLLRTNFLYVCSSLYVASAQYERGLLTAHRLREAADASGVGFAVDYSLLTAAAASVGMRQLGESQRYLKELRQRGSDNGHIRANATIIAAKARVAAGDLDAAGILLQQRPAAEVSRAMLAEHIANEALVLASLARHEEADRLLAEARGLSHDSEACTVALLASGVIGLRMRQDGQAARTAVREALNKGFLDAAAVASRAFPPLAKEAASSADLRPMLAALFAASRDVGLGRSAGLPMPRELQRSAGLSPREREVYDLVVLGRTNREIAKTLYISESTAKVHVRHILEKLGVHSRAEAAGVRDDPP